MYDLNFMIIKKIIFILTENWRLYRNLKYYQCLEQLKSIKKSKSIGRYFYGLHAKILKCILCFVEYCVNKNT